MFYSHVILARKGPLGKIWLAAHWDKKLTKNQIFATDISASVESILAPAAPLALRVSGHLMLGIVRIYSRKVKYLMSDCTEAMWKIKMAFRPGNVDMAETAAIAAPSATDDPRYFGMAQSEVDFPELEDIAFDDGMLMHFEELKAARGRTLASARDTTHEFDYEGDVTGARSPLIQHTSGLDLGDERRAYLDRSGGSRDSRVSDIEMARRERSSLGGVGAGRPSLSSVGAGLEVGYDDEIPAYDEQDFFGGDTGVGDFAAGDDYGGQVQGDAGFEAPQDDDAINQDAVFAEALAGPGEIRVPAFKARKKARIVVDDRVEMSARAIKENVKSVGDVLRRLPSAPLPKRRRTDGLSNEARLSLPSDRDLCPELSDIFGLIFDKRGYPYRGRSPAGVAAVEIGRDDQLHQQGGLGAGRPSIMSGVSGGLDDDVGGANTMDLGGGDDFQFQDDFEMSPGGMGSDDMPSSFAYAHDEELPGSADETSATSGRGSQGNNVWSGRTAEVREILSKELSGPGAPESVLFSDLTQGLSKRQAATCFLEALHLQTNGMVRLQQNKPFDEIAVHATPALTATA